MRLSPLLVLALLTWPMVVGEVYSQAPKARKWTDCDQVCLALAEAIQDKPDTLVMRLEDALVIREACAGEIVHAAISAVGADPALVNKIVQTALHVAPQQTRSIRYAATNFTPRAAVALAYVDEPPEKPAFEVRRAQIPARPTTAGPQEEIRRAYAPGLAAAEPVPEVRRAIRVATLMPTEEIRRAETSPRNVIYPGAPSFRLSQRDQSTARRTR